MPGEFRIRPRVCGVIGARDALKCKARVIGVISDRANTYRLSLDAGRCVPTNSALTFADGVAVRVPDEEALAIMQAGMERLAEITDDEVAEAIRILYSDTHTLAEGAGAAAFAALMKERGTLQAKRSDGDVRTARPSSGLPCSSTTRTVTGSDFGKRMEPRSIVSPGSARRIFVVVGPQRGS